MIKKVSDFKTELRENMRGGDGVVTVTSFVSADELNDKGRLFGKSYLSPDAASASISTKPTVSFSTL